MARVEQVYDVSSSLQSKRVTQFVLTGRRVCLRRAISPLNPRGVDGYMPQRTRALLILHPHVLLNICNALAEEFVSD